MTARRAKERRRAFLWGHVAEYLAALFLLLKGYRIVAMRFRTPAGEIDIIARRRDVVAFVEVKARRSLEAAVDAVNVQSQRRIHNASLAWLSRQTSSSGLSLRYDIVAIVPLKVPRHLENAF